MSLPKLGTRPGFTLIELLTVISIIALLLALATVSYSNARQKGRDAKRKSDLKTIQQALELHFQTNGFYPGWDGWCTIISSAIYPQVRTALEPTYISKVPTDPLYSQQPKDYLFWRKSATSYELVSILENLNDPDRGAYDYSWCNQGYNPYNYKVTNP